MVGCGGKIAAATKSTEAASAVTLSEPVSRKPSSELIEELSCVMEVCGGLHYMSLAIRPRCGCHDPEPCQDPKFLAHGRQVPLAKPGSMFGWVDAFMSLQMLDIRSVMSRQ